MGNAQMLPKLGRISSTIKPSVLRCYHRELTSDSTAASNATEEEVDKRVKQMLEMEPDDPQTLTNLAECHHGGTQDQVCMFWSECSKFLSKDVGLAVDDRRHTSVTHLAKVISVRDLLEQVQAWCPHNCPIPSHEWL